MEPYINSTIAYVWMDVLIANLQLPNSILYRKNDSMLG